MAAHPPRRPRAPEERGGEGPAWDAFISLDEAATRSGGNFRARLIWSLSLHFTAALIAAFTAAFSPVIHYRAGHVYAPGGAHAWQASLLHALPMVATFIEFALVCWACWLMWQVGRRHLHHRWRRTRFAAELAHGAIMSARLLDPLRPLIVRHDPRWKRFAITMALLAHRKRAKARPARA